MESMKVAREKLALKIFNSGNILGGYKESKASEIALKCIVLHEDPFNKAGLVRDNVLKFDVMQESNEILEATIDYVEDIIAQSPKLISSVNLPIAFYVAKISILEKVPKEIFTEKVVTFFDRKNEHLRWEYKMYSNAGSAKSVNVLKRIAVLAQVVGVKFDISSADSMKLGSANYNKATNDEFYRLRSKLEEHLFAQEWNKAKERIDEIIMLAEKKK
ncbi:hypothetical protein MKY96_32495 [Paenibacillus sp. FSL R7-0302]|uniref:hypothetical protein n=1 Tax=Paenibacillus sp. FSL R7-0302 TaxID=2921681 RepID=UPI0030FCFA60